MMLDLRHVPEFRHLPKCSGAGAGDTDAKLLHTRLER